MVAKPEDAKKPEHNGNGFWKLSATALLSLLLGTYGGAHFAQLKDELAQRELRTLLEERMAKYHQEQILPSRNDIMSRMRDLEAANQAQLALLTSLRDKVDANSSKFDRLDSYLRSPQSRP